MEGFKYLGVNSPEQQGVWIRGEEEHVAGRNAVLCHL